MKKICIINDIVGPLSGEKENFWTWLVKELSATPIHFSQLKIPLEEAIKKENPDIIINNSIWGFTFPDYFTITILQDPYIQMQELLGVNLSEQIEKQKRALKYSQIRVAVSNYMVQSYKDCGDFKVIPVGSDSELFKPMNKQAMRKKYGIPSDRIVCIYVGSHNPVKGWAEIKAEIDKRNAFWILVFKDYYSETEADNTKVFCRIPQDQLAELYALSDFFVSKSVCESGGLAAIEALFCGVPVLTPRIGLFWDWMPENKNPRKEAFEKGLDKKTCMERWKKLIEEVKM